MRIHQLQLSFDAREDRLLLRIGTVEREEIRVALTRRLVRKLWPHLRRMLEGHLASDEPATVEVAPAADEPGALANGSFDTPFDEADVTLPLGAEPVLAMESRLQPLDGPICRVMLGEARARKVSFDCDRDLMEALCAMIRASVDKAEWNLDLDALPATETLDASAEPTPTLH